MLVAWAHRWVHDPIGQPPGPPTRAPRKLRDRRSVAHALIVGCVTVY
jgi:hypothetical protein